MRAGRPLRARSCGAAAPLPAGRATLVSTSASSGDDRGRDQPSARGDLLRADLLRLRSPAPRPLPAPAVPGRVLDPGDDGRGRRDGVRVVLTMPAWLVLAESFNRGWRAECDGRDLGEPRPVDGFANGWRAPRDCRDVGFSFAPQRTMNAGFAISVLACAALVVLLVTGRRRRRGISREGETLISVDMWPKSRSHGAAGGLPRRWAVAIGAAAGLVGAFVFALRAGVVIGPAVALLLWRGVGPGALALTAGALTAIVLPAIYLLFPPDDAGGFNSEFAADLTGAHWVAVAVWALFALAVALTVSTASRRRRAGAPPGAGAGSAGP